MDVLPAHLNRDSFRDSFKGLVALEIILDLPFGFPINNIISRVSNRSEICDVSQLCTNTPALLPYDVCSGEPSNKVL